MMHHPHIMVNPQIGDIQNFHSFFEQLKRDIRCLHFLSMAQRQKTICLQKSLAPDRATAVFEARGLLNLFRPMLRLLSPHIDWKSKHTSIGTYSDHPEVAPIFRPLAG